MSSELPQVLIRSAAVITVLMTLVWLLSVWRKDASIVDPFWGLGFVLVAWAAYLMPSTDERASLLLPLMVTVWGTRLSGYLTWRNHGKPEDYRYQAMRKHWGSRFWWVSLFTVFALQGAIMWVVSLPLQVGLAQPSQNIAWLRYTGVAIWLAGFLFETIGDWQLARFKAARQDKQQVMDRGLWRYTRHPNYFGDFLVWWGFYLVALSQGAPWWTIVGPILMSWLLIRVSGVSLLERNLLATRPAYADYVARTSAFIPMRPSASTELS